MIRILFATSNPHKVHEGNETGKEFGIEFKQISVPYSEIRDEDVGRIAEDGANFVFSKIKKPVIVEDTGLFIDALNGFPGPYSAFVFRKIGNDGILRLMKNIKNRKAEFISAIGYCDLEGVKIFKGILNGTIARKPKGNEGFGYDPIFIPDKSKKILLPKNSKGIFGHKILPMAKFSCRKILTRNTLYYDKKTLAEDFNLKNQISHRKKAFEKFCRWYRNRFLSV